MTFQVPEERALGRTMAAPPAIASKALAAATYQRGAEVITAALRRLFGREPTAAELYAALITAALESGCGTWAYQNVTPPSLASARVNHNWGAFQAGSSWAGETFTATDRHSDGSTYSIRFRVYPTAEDGALDMCRLMASRGVFDAVHRNPTIEELARAMRAARYYEGIGATDAERIAGRVAAHEAHDQAIARALGHERPGLARESAGALPPGDDGGAFVVLALAVAWALARAQLWKSVKNGFWKASP